MSSGSTQPPRRRPHSVPRPRTVAGRTQGRLRLTSPTPAPRSWWRRATRRIRRFIGRVFTAGVWSRIGRLTTWIGAVGVAVAAFTGLGFTYAQYRLTERGQVTDRFTKAVEQLGKKDQVDVRLGGIYSLERLARDSPPDHAVIFEVLSAYVRTHAPIGPGGVARDGTGCGEAAPHPPGGVGLGVAAVDVQAVLTVIGRRERSSTPSRGQIYAIDLSDSCLQGAYLSEADLSGADMRLTNISDASLSGSDLTGADFFAANLNHTLCGGANFTGASLSAASLVGAQLTGANLTGALLMVANLAKADLSGANLARATLVEADLRGANLAGANLAEADLSGANLAEADLASANLSSIFYDDSTEWPDGFPPPPSTTEPR